MLKRFCQDLDATVGYCKKEEILNSEKYSELARTSTSTITLEDNRLNDEAKGNHIDTPTAVAMILFNNGYTVTVMEPVINNHDAVNTPNACQDLTSGHIRNDVLSSTNITDHSIHYYFSSTFEVAKYVYCWM